MKQNLIFISQSKERSVPSLFPQGAPMETAAPFPQPIYYYWSRGNKRVSKDMLIGQLFIETALVTVKQLTSCATVSLTVHKAVWQ